MSAARATLDTAIRRSLAFHLGIEEERERELLVCAVLDAADAGTLRGVGDVAREFEDYLPDACFASESGREELFDDMLRDTLKHFPLDVSRSADDVGDVDGVEDGDEDVDPGCCLLCERLMPLTRHHVMPRSTHKRYRKKGCAEDVLNRTIDICRPCHSAIHRSHDAATLAERFTTREKLLEDEAVGRFVAWAKKQRVTTKQDATNNLLRYRK